MKYPISAFSDAIEALLRLPAYKTMTVFIRPKSKDVCRVMVTWRRRPRAGAREQEMAVTFGRPNYKERKYLVNCKKGKYGKFYDYGNRRLWLQSWPKKRERK